MTIPSYFHATGMNKVGRNECHKIKATLACFALHTIFLYIQWKTEIIWTPEPVN